MRRHVVAFWLLASCFVAPALTSGCKTGAGSQVLDEQPMPQPADGPGQPVLPPEPVLESTGGLRYYEYDVRFTNPVCKEYAYGADQTVVSVGGETLTAKPRNVFCTASDAAASATRPESPQYKLLSWINDPDVKEIFFAYLSFSNRVVMQAVCKAIKERDVKVTFVLDQTTDLTVANDLLACNPLSGDTAKKPKMLLRGQTGGIGYAHNKTFIINPGATTMKVAVSSGNMTSGIVLHHENWHFVTLPSDTYFAQMHLCLVKGVTDFATSTTSYANFIKQCRGQIAQPEESDIKVFFIPGDGVRATSYITDGIKRAERVRLAAHRFSYNKLIAALKSELSSSEPAKVDMVFDDDVYWAGHGEQTGDNQASEYNNAMSLVNLGAQAKWMETNHAMHLLHHNKYLIFDMPQGSQYKSAVFCGAGNLTGTAFNSNFENFYYVEIPSVVQKYNAQYDHVWNDLASTYKRLPTENILPPGAGG